MEGGFNKNEAVFLVEFVSDSKYIVWDGNHRLCAINFVNGRISAGHLKGTLTESVPCLVFKGNIFEIFYISNSS